MVHLSYEIWNFPHPKKEQLILCLAKIFNITQLGDMWFLLDWHILENILMTNSVRVYETSCDDWGEQIHPFMFIKSPSRHNIVIVSSWNSKEYMSEYFMMTVRTS